MLIHLSAYFLMISQYIEVNLLGYYLDKSLGWDGTLQIELLEEQQVLPVLLTMGFLFYGMQWPSKTA